MGGKRTLESSDYQDHDCADDYSRECDRNQPGGDPPISALNLVVDPLKA